MKGSDGVVASEHWSVETKAGTRSLKSKGEERGGRELAWALDARLTGAGEVEALELQVHPTSRMSEVTTVAFRCYGGRAFGTVIPPGGVPDKFETAFPAGATFRGFSVALEGLSAGALPLKVGHGRRLLVVDLDTPDFRPRVADAMFLAKARERTTTPGGEEWCLTYEFRWADEPGRAQSLLTLTRNGLVLRGERTLEGKLAPFELASFAP